MLRSDIPRGGSVRAASRRKAGALSSLLLLLAPGILGAQATAEVAPSDTLRAAVLPDWPPHYMRTPEGEPTGFAVDMIEAVGRRAGLTVEYEVVPDFSAALEALRSGRVDVIPDFGVALDRDAEVRFTRPFGAFRISLITRRSGPALQPGLREARVGAVAINAGGPLVRERYPAAEIEIFGDVREALYDLLAAGVDAVVYPEEVFLALARAGGVEDRLVVVEPPLAEVSRAMAVRPSDAVLAVRLDLALEGLVDSEEYRRIYRRWFGVTTPFWTVRRVVLGAALTLALALLGMAAWRYRSVSALARDLKRTLDERDRAETARAETHRTLRRTLESLDGAVFVVDPDGRRVVECNAAAERMFGRSRDALMGGDTRDLHVDEEHYEEFGRLSGEVLLGGGTYEGTFRMRRANGTTFPTRHTVTLLDPERGLPGGVVSVVYDISAEVRARESLEESEERFRQLAERIRDVFWITTPDKGHMEYVSPAYEEIWGLSRQALYADASTWLDAIHPEDRDRVAAALPGQVRGAYDVEYRIVRPDGTLRWISDRAYPVHDLDGGVVRVVGVARDITEARDAEAARATLEAQLRQAQRLEAVGRLAGGVAHDFNNLLTVIRSQTDLVKMELPPSSQLASELEVVQTAADRAARVTGQLLAFSRDQILRPRVVELGVVVRDIAVLLERILGENTRMVLDLGADLPPAFLDPGHLEQAVMNLGINARDAMPGGGTITLRTFASDAHPPGPPPENGPPAALHVVLQVTDTGQGMDDETSRRIFEPFFTTKARGTGTGLGLAMVYGFVTQSGGRIDVVSAPGEGATFSLWFPVQATGNGPTVAEGVEAPRGATGPLEAPRTGEVLIVEDDPRVRRVVSRILGHAGFRTTDVEDAEGALEAMEKGYAPDLLLTDLGMPGLGGRALIDRFQTLRPGVPVVAMSGYAVGALGPYGDLPDSVLFIQKPFTGEELVEGVRRALSTG